MTYSARHLLLAGLLGLLLGALAVASVRAAARPEPTVPVFREVVVPAAAPTQPAASAPVPPLIVDPFPVSPSPERAAVEVPSPELYVAPRTAVAVTGTASWYRWRPGEAAAGPALRVGDWRGRVVTVCAAACVVVRLSDFCQCYGSRVIDLDSRSFAALAPLSAGLVSVTVRW